MEVSGEKMSKMEEEFLQWEDEVVEPYISVNALAGSQNFQTMRVKGVIQNRVVYILVDSGSTHNFLDVNLAKELGCNIETISAQAITVADGNNIPCNQVCKGLEWTMSNNKFITEAMLIPLGGCDMVLGIQWLSTFC